jgi:hypothetical protein
MSAPPTPASEPIPSAQTLAHAARIAIQQDKPIMLDYYVESVEKKAFMGEDAETKEKVLIKSSEEFTSMVQKVYKIQEDFIILTENSLYIVSANIDKRRIQAKALREKYDS